MNHSKTEQSGASTDLLSGVSVLDVGVKFVLLALSMAFIVVGTTWLEGTALYLSLFASMFVISILLNFMGTSVDAVWQSFADG